MNYDKEMKQWKEIMANAEEGQLKFAISGVSRALLNEISGAEQIDKPSSPLRDELASALEYLSRRLRDLQ